MPRFACFEACAKSVQAFPLILRVRERSERRAWQESGPFDRSILGIAVRSNFGGEDNFECDMTYRVVKRSQRAIWPRPIGLQRDRMLRFGIVAGDVVPREPLLRYLRRRSAA